MVKRRWKKLGRGRNDRTDIELVIQAVNVVVNNERGNSELVKEEAEEEFRRFWASHRDIAGRNLLLTMFCPQAGLYLSENTVHIIFFGGGGMKKDMEKDK